MTELNANKFARPLTATVFVLVFSLCLVVPRSAARAHTVEAADSIAAAQVRGRVQRLGLGAKVKVSTAFQSEHYHGYITSIGENSFEVTDVSKWKDHSFAYSSVTELAGRELPVPSVRSENRELRVLFNIASKLRIGP